MKYLNKFISINEERPGRYVTIKKPKYEIDLNSLKSNLEVIFNHKDMWTSLYDANSGEYIYDIIGTIQGKNASDIINNIKGSMSDTELGVLCQKSDKFTSVINYITNLQPKIQELIDTGFIIKYSFSFARNLRYKGKKVLYISFQNNEDCDISTDMFLYFFESLKSVKMRIDVNIIEISLGYITLEIPMT